MKPHDSIPSAFVERPQTEMRIRAPCFHDDMTRRRTVREFALPPRPMAILNEVLGRPDNERPFLLLVAGSPAEGARVPNMVRKPLEAMARFIE